MGEIIEFDCVGGGAAPGYLAMPASGGNSPGVVVIQEWWGMNGQIKSVADRFAEAGYRALVPDLYRGRVTQDPDEANHLMTGLDWAGAAREDVRGAAQHLKAGGAKVGVMGFCMGGALTIIAAVHAPEVDAAVCYYGIPPAEAADPQQIRVPFQGHFATRDEWCSPAAVADLESKLQAGGVSHEIYNYEADHAFFNQERPDVYVESAAEESWARTLAFFKQHL